MKILPAFSALLVLASCSPDQQPAAAASAFDDPNVVATVGTETITRAHIEAVLSERPGAPETILDQLIEHRALVQEARESGMERDPEFIAAVERMMVNRMKEKREAEAPAGISEAEIKARYDSQRQNWTMPARARFAMIFMETPANCSAERKAELLTRMNEVRAAALAAPDKFTALAAEHSSDQATRYRGGDIGYIVQGTGAEEVDDEVLAAAFALPAPGGLTNIITTPRGHWLVRLTDRTAATVRPLADVQEMIRAELRRERSAIQEAQSRTKLLASRSIQRRTDRLPPARTETARAEVPPSPPR